MLARSLATELSPSSYLSMASCRCASILQKRQKKKKTRKAWRARDPLLRTCLRFIGSPDLHACEQCPPCSCGENRHHRPDEKAFLSLSSPSFFATRGTRAGSRPCLVFFFIWLPRTFCRVLFSGEDEPHTQACAEQRGRETRDPTWRNDRRRAPPESVVFPRPTRETQQQSRNELSERANGSFLVVLGRYCLFEDRSESSCFSLTLDSTLFL